MLKIPKKPKTIKELNEFMIYRLIKVVYTVFLGIISLSIILGSYTNLLYEHHIYLDADQSYVACDSGDILNIKEKKVELTDQDKLEYKHKCSLNSDDSKEKLQQDNSLFSDILNYDLPESDNYTANLVYEKPVLKNYLEFLGVIIIGYVFLFFLHQVIKRVFYYVFFGRMYPDNE